MGVLVWGMVGPAILHFTGFVPDHFWAGIVGALVGACIGAALFGLLIHGFSVPGTDETDVLTALEAIPGAIIGLAAIYFLGLRLERREAELHGGLT